MRSYTEIQVDYFKTKATLNELKRDPWTYENRLGLLEYKKRLENIASRLTNIEFEKQLCFQIQNEELINI